MVSLRKSTREQIGISKKYIQYMIASYSNATSIIKQQDDFSWVSSLDKIELRATLLNGEAATFEMESSSTVVDLSNRSILAIDLSLLDEFSKMEQLVLKDNSFMSVDLSVLAFCPSMHGVNLSHNKLRTIDLSSVGYCSRLESLDLSSNQILRIELNALSKCEKLTSLNLMDNQLVILDLEPLSKCGRLEELNLQNNPIMRLDVTPLFMCASLRQLLVSDDTRLVSTYKQEVEFLIPPALNELINNNRVEFISQGQ